MTCPHAETTAILAVFGEAPADFAEHLVDCEACQAVVNEHRQTVALISPVLQAPATPERRRRRWPLLAVLAAAAALLVLRPSPAPTPTHAPLPSLTELQPIADDSEIFAMELELALMDLEN